MNWSEGYVTDVGYTFSYHPELCPSRLRLACLSAGLVPPEPKQLRYLELGFGQGLPINIHAAAVPGEFWGTDFNPTHAAFAQALADASGSGAALFDDSFAELAKRSDLPQFDIIALHGIWTWISEENRQVIVDIIRRKLRVGGLVYISYNCLPGWAPVAPLRHLIKLYDDLASSNMGGMVGRLDAALKFTQQVVDSGALYFRNNPALAERLKQIAALNRSYLAHEYLNLDWGLMAFSDMARTLDGAKLTFATSAHLLDHIGALNLSNEWQKLLAEIQHPILHQTVRDYMVNKQFRRDIFVKGRRQLSGPDQLEMLRSQRFVLITHPDDIPMKVKTDALELTLNEANYRPLIEVLAEKNYAARTLSYLAGHAKLNALQFPQLFEALLTLLGAGHVHPAQEATNVSRQRCKALNRYLCDRARSNGDINHLASPVTGSGIVVRRAQQLFLLAAQHGKNTVSEQVAYAWELLSAQGHMFRKEGKVLQTAEENIAELTRQAIEFTEKRLPILKVLGIA